MGSKVSIATVAALGGAQTLAWASSVYLPAVLATPMARAFDVTPPTIFAAFSAALVVSALLGPYAGAAIDRFGGRPVLIATNVVFACGLAILGTAPNLAVLVAGWLVLGIGMGSGLYEAAFAALVRLHGRDARGAITGITLIAGFASTIGWPLSTWLAETYGWRDACLAWAALHVVVGIPLNACLPATDRIGLREVATDAPDRAEAASRPVDRRAAWLLAYVFAAAGFVTSAMAAHLPRLLQVAGASVTVAVAVGALVGPAQVAARVFEYGVLRRAHPLWSARLASLLHPAGAVLLLAGGAPAAAAFAILHGAGNGILTIARGTLPLALFGPDGYGRRQGMLTIAARIAQALAPWLFGVFLERWGTGALWTSTALALSGFVALMVLPKHADDAAPLPRAAT